MTIDNHNFYIQTKNLESIIVESALRKAHDYKEEMLPDWKANMLSRRLSKEAFEDFKKKITEQFPYESYSDLISLTLKARTNYFFHSLPEDMKVIILRQQSSLVS